MATCDAGNGCSITCPNGCGAVYNHDTGKCTKWCEGSFTRAEADPAAFEGTFTIQVSDLDPQILLQAMGARGDGPFAALAKAGKRLDFRYEKTTLEELARQLG